MLINKPQMREICNNAFLISCVLCPSQQRSLCRACKAHKNNNNSMEERNKQQQQQQKKRIKWWSPPPGMAPVQSLHKFSAFPTRNANVWIICPLCTVRQLCDFHLKFLSQTCNCNAPFDWLATPDSRLLTSDSPGSPDCRLPLALDLYCHRPPGLLTMRLSAALGDCCCCCCWLWRCVDTDKCVAAASAAISTVYALIFATKWHYL